MTMFLIHYYPLEHYNIFLENVANLLGHDDGKSFLTIYNTLVPFGYSFKYQVMDALDYGNIPQRRSRIFIVAFLDDQMCDRFKFPEKIERTVQLNDILIRSIKHDDSYYFHEDSKDYYKLKQIVKSKAAAATAKELITLFFIKNHQFTDLFFGFNSNM